MSVKSTILLALQWPARQRRQRRRRCRPERIGESFFDEIVCGRADVYFAGHDHSLQWLTSDCACTALIVSGVGSQPSTLPGVNPVRFQSLGPGFAYVHIEGETMTVELASANGATLFARSFTKP